MNILAFFTDGGVPKTGLLPLIKIIDVNTSAVIIAWELMTEISDGWYKYDFIIYDYTKEYVVLCDGGVILPDYDRYHTFSSDNSKTEIAQIVWNANVNSFQMANSFGELLKNTSNDLKRALGLLHENIYIDNPTYDQHHNLVTARVRIYSSPADVGTNNGVIGIYAISSTGNGCAGTGF